MSGSFSVSAIVPAYNRADFLEETLESLLGQSAPPKEVIVVDDGSMDHTPEILAAFGAKIRTVRIENGGAPVARNVGARLATGDWLWLCDSDDLWSPDYQARCRGLAEHPLAPSVIFGNFRLVQDGALAETSKFESAPNGFWEGISTVDVGEDKIAVEAMYRHILRFQTMFQSTLMIKRDLFQSLGGFDESFARMGSEDFEFTLRAAGSSPIGVVTEPLVGIRRHAGNFSGNQLRNLLGEITILRHALAHHAAAKGLETIIEDEISERSLQALDYAFAKRDFTLVKALAANRGGLALTLADRVKVVISNILTLKSA